MWPRIKNSIAANLVLLLVAFMTAYGALNLARYGWGLRNESREVQKRIEELVKKKQELDRYRAELETKEAAEKRAKERLNLKLPGEKVVVLVSQNSAAGPESFRQASGFFRIWSQVRNFFSKISASLGL